MSSAISTQLPDPLDEFIIEVVREEFESTYIPSELRAQMSIGQVSALSISSNGNGNGNSNYEEKEEDIEVKSPNS